MMAAGILVFLTLVLLKLGPASTQTCNDFGFYCVSDTSFQQCVDSGPPVGPVNVCGSGTFCSMDCSLQCLQVVPCTTTTTQLPTTTTTVLTTTTTELPTTTTTVLPTTTTVLPTTTTELPTTTVLPTTTTTTTTTTELPTTTEAPFVCTASGRFADPTNCTNYYMCSPMSNGSFYQYLYPCPGGSVFNPATSKCTIDSTGTICPSSSPSSSPATPSSTSSTTSTTSTTASTPSSSSSTTSSTSTSTTTTTTTTTTVAPDFKCTAPGRFPDPLDCTKYYLCSSDGKGGFYKYLYTCPIGSAFNPATAKCSATAVCPLKLPLNYSAHNNNNRFL